METADQTIFVFDTSALIAFLECQEGAEVVRQILIDCPDRLYSHALILCEVYSHIIRVHGAPLAHHLIDGLLKAGVNVRQDMDTDFWQQAGRIQATYPQLLLSDGFCIGLAGRIGGEIVSANHREFDPLISLGLCTVRFIR